MPSRTALLDAIELARTPRLARKLRAEALPDGIPHLLRVAAGNGPALAESAARLERSPESLESAAVLYVVQILLHPEADCRRALGASATASREELRSNFTLLMKWLHPDVIREDAFAVYARRVISAWQELDGAPASSPAITPPASSAGSGQARSVSGGKPTQMRGLRHVTIAAAPPRKRRFGRWTFAALAAALALLVSTVVWPGPLRPDCGDPRRPEEGVRSSCAIRPVPPPPPAGSRIP